MNLAKLEQMVRDGDLSRNALLYFLSCRGECEWLDFKEFMNLESDRDLCGFTKDVIAMKNVGGGFIVIGVRDKTWEPVGITTELPYDSKMLRDKVMRSSGLTLEIDIVHHHYQGTTDKILAIIHIRASRKRSKRRMPSIVSKDFCHNQSFGLRRGDIYARKGDSTIKITSGTELESLLESLEEQSDYQKISTASNTSPFAINDGTYKLLEKGFENFIGRLDLREKVLSSVMKDPRIWIINVHGPGGVGKSALVTWVTYEFYKSKEFEAILQLTAKETILTDKGIQAFSRSLYSLENLLDHILMLFQESIDMDFEQKKSLAIEILSAWKTLIVLDNMETISDGRILSFIQDLPPESKAKIILTSRFKTGSWELPISVNELHGSEIREFIQIKSSELGISFPIDDVTLRKVEEVTGGLPLAIQWVLGQYKHTRELKNILNKVNDKDSPVLEFSFRNIWNAINSDAKTLLAVLSIFDTPPTLQELGIATEMRSESIEKALADLIEVTLVASNTRSTDGLITYSALPITITFARHQLANMGDLEVLSRRRIQQFNEQLELQSTEIKRFKSDFDTYGIQSEHERRAAILCKRAQSEFFSGRIIESERLFQQARDLAPTSSYVNSMVASFKLASGQIGEALNCINEACKRITPKTGSLCYSIKAQILDAQRDRKGRLEALEIAIKYDQSDSLLQHQYGVALSRMGREQEAIHTFTKIIDSEKHLLPPKDTFIAALTTRIINLQRLNQQDNLRKDLSLAKEILTKYPYLGRTSDRLRELVDDSA